MKKRSDMITNLFFRLLPVQILLLAIGSINSVIDGVMASNFIGADAMTVTGLYMNTRSGCGGDFRPLHRRALPAPAGQGSAVIPMISSKYKQSTMAASCYFIAKY
jgi:hypothetical protein